MPEEETGEKKWGQQLKTKRWKKNKRQRMDERTRHQQKIQGGSTEKRRMTGERLPGRGK